MKIIMRKVKQGLKEGKTFLQFGFLKAVGEALVMFVPLVVAKFFSPDLFGSYSLAKMVVFFFSSLLIASSQAPFIVFANQEKVRSGKINKAFSVQCVFLVLSLCIFVVITLPLSKYIMKFAKINRVDLFFVLLAFVGLALKFFLCNVFMALGQRIKNSLAELTFGFVSLLLIFVFYFLGRINLRTTLAIYPFSAVVVVLIFLKSIDFKLLFPFKLEKEYFHKMLDFTKWVLLGSTAVYFINWGDNLVLRYFVSMRDIGYYNLGYQVFKGVATLAYIINTYFLPFVSQHIENAAKMRSYLFNKRPKIFILGFAAIGLLFVLAPYLFSFFYGDVYQDSINVLRVLLVGSVLILYINFYIPILNSLKRYKFTQIVNVIQVLLNLLLNLLLVPQIGMLGAAIATVFAYFCTTAIYEVYFRIKVKKLLGL